MPTTSSFKGSGLVTWLGVIAGMSAPDVALNSSCVPTAPAGESKPRARASLSVSTISLAPSDLGRRPAESAGTALDDPVGGKERTWPAGFACGAAPDRAPPTAVNVPLI